jgi:hypothetical protein
VLVVEVGELVLHLAHAGHHGQHVGDRAHPPHGDELVQEVLQRELLATEQLRRHLLLLVGVERLLGLLDQGEHVAHAEDPAGHPVRVEDVEVLQLLAGGGEEDRLAGDLPYGQRRAAAGVAVQFGQHHAGDAHAVAERLGRGHRVLTDHRVDDEDDLVRRDGVADVRGLRHHLGVDAQPAGGVDDDDVAGGPPGVLDRVAGHRDRVADAVAGLRRVHLDAGPLAEHLELVDRVRPLQVGRDQHGLMSLGLQPPGQLAGQGGLAGALEPGEHDHRRRLLGEPQPAGLAAEHGDQFLVDDLDDLLGRVERLGDLGAERPGLEVGDEGLDHGQRDVGLEQGQPDLAGGGVDVGVGQPTLAPELGEDPGEAVAQGVKHDETSRLSRCGGREPRRARGRARPPNLPTA